MAICGIVMFVQGSLRRFSLIENLDRVVERINRRRQTEEEGKTN